jgi:crotonobetainyl-CoA:carnitine CoA-transferase CaiB-like acyl-CoA transferase
MTERTGPLSDIRVIDFTQALAGPFCTMLLADLGADVIKVEWPRGDLTRGMPPFPQDRDACDYGGYFASVNRNKRAIALDLDLEEDREILYRLVKTADAFVENARAGVFDRHGAGYETLREHNPRLVYAAIRGFGDPRTGASEYVDRPAFDIVAQSMGGLVSATGPPESTGYPAGSSVGDIFPGTLAALGVVSAIHAARRTGQGQFLDVAMYDAILLLCEQLVYHYSYDGKVNPPRGRGHQMLVPFDVFDTKDGAVAIAAPTPKHWAVLCGIIGCVELIDDPRTFENLARVRNRELVTGVIADWTTQHTRQEVLDDLGGRVPVGPVNTMADIFADPHIAIRGMLPDVELPGGQTVKLAGPAIKMTATPTAIYRRPPLLNEHRGEILAELGLPEDFGARGAK